MASYGAIDILFAITMLVFGLRVTGGGGLLEIYDNNVSMSPVSHPHYHGKR